MATTQDARMWIENLTKAHAELCRAKYDDFERDDDFMDAVQRIENVIGMIKEKFYI